MKLIIGLGNPGTQYAGTRHNAGCQFVDKFAEVLSAKCEGLSSGYGWRRFYGVYVYKTPEIIMAKTADYFMNESGNVVRDVMRLDELRTKNQELYLAHDDLDIKLGEYKVQFGKGPKEHNGVNSAERALGTDQFWRIRMGIDNRAGERESRRAGEEYVLQKFNEGEREVLDRVFEKIYAELI